MSNFITQLVYVGVQSKLEADMMMVIMMMTKATEVAVITVLVFTMVVTAVMLVAMDCVLRFSECICLSLQQPARMSSGS